MESCHALSHKNKLLLESMHWVLYIAAKLVKAITIVIDTAAEMTIKSVMLMTLMMIMKGMLKNIILMTIITNA